MQYVDGHKCYGENKVGKRECLRWTGNFKYGGHRRLHGKVSHEHLDQRRERTLGTCMKSLPGRNAKVLW